MNLTDNLVDGVFYYTSSGIEKCHICTVNGIKEVVTPKGSVWQPVPSYDHFVELTEKVKRLEKKNQIWSELAENLLSLEEKNWESLVDNGTKEHRFDFLKHKEKYSLLAACDENLKLRQLLKDSIYILNEYKHYFDVKHHNMTAVIIEKANEVLK